MRTQGLRGQGETGRIVPFPEFRVRHVHTVDMGETEIQPRNRGVVEFTRRDVVAHVVPTIVREPHLTRVGMPRESDGVAYPGSKDLPSAAVRLHPQDAGIGILPVTHVAGCSHGHIEHSVRPERHVFPPVVPIGGQIIHDHNGLGRIRQTVQDVVVAQDAAHLCHVEGAMAEGHPIGHVQAFGNQILLLCRPVPVRIAEGMDQSGLSGADKHHIVRRKRQRTCILDAVRPHRDFPPLGQAELLEPGIRPGRRVRSAPDAQGAHQENK